MSVELQLACIIMSQVWDSPIKLGTCYIHEGLLIFRLGPGQDCELEKA